MGTMRYHHCSEISVCQSGGALLREVVLNSSVACTSAAGLVLNAPLDESWSSVLNFGNDLHCYIAGSRPELL